MPVLIFNKSCGGVPLKTVGFILGIIHLVFLVKVTILHVASDSIKIMPLYEYEGLRRFIPLQSIGLTLFLVQWLLALAFDIILLIGLSKNKPGYLQAFLIYCLVFLVHVTNEFIYLTTMLATNINDDYVSDHGMSVLGIIETVATVGIFFVLVLHVSLILTVRSLYHHMTEMKPRSQGLDVFNAA